MEESQESQAERSRELSGSLLRDEDGAEARRSAGVDIGDDARELRQVEVAVVVGVTLGTVIEVVVAVAGAVGEVAKSVLGDDS